MPASATNAAYRIVQRKSLRRQPCLAIPAVRPSLLDIFLRGDAWIGHDGGILTLFIGDRQLASFPGLGFDEPALNQLLFAIRSRPPRKIVRHAARVPTY